MVAQYENLVVLGIARQGHCLVRNNALYITLVGGKYGLRGATKSNEIHEQLSRKKGGDEGVVSRQP